MRAMRAMRAMREVPGGQVGCTLVNCRSESNDLLRPIFSVLGDGHGTCAGGDDRGGDDSEGGDFHGSDISVLLRDF